MQDQERTSKREADKRISMDELRSICMGNRYHARCAMFDQAPLESRVRPGSVRNRLVSAVRHKRPGKLPTES